MIPFSQQLYVIHLNADEMLLEVAQQRRWQLGNP